MRVVPAEKTYCKHFLLPGILWPFRHPDPSLPLACYLSNFSLNPLTHSWCSCVSRRACTSPLHLPLCVSNRSWRPVSDRLTGVHHSLAQKNRQHDGCALCWHLQPEPQYCFKSRTVCSRVCACVLKLTNCRLPHVSSSHHSVWWSLTNTVSAYTPALYYYISVPQKTGCSGHVSTPVLEYFCFPSEVEATFLSLRKNSSVTLS